MTTVQSSPESSSTVDRRPAAPAEGSSEVRPQPLAKDAVSTECTPPRGDTLRGPAPRLYEPGATHEDVKPPAPPAAPQPVPVAPPALLGGYGVVAQASPPDSAQRPPEAEDPADAVERQAIATAVNRMTLRRDARAEIDVPEIGRVVVAARPRHAEVDIAVTASVQGCNALRALQPELRLYLRDASIAVGRLDIATDSGADRSGHGAPGETPRRPDAHPDEQRATEDTPSPVRRRARFVL